MLGNISSAPPRRALEFGIYRDGDNNLDESQAVTLAQAVDVSREDSSVAFAIEDTTSRDAAKLHTEEYTIADGIQSKPLVERPHNMAATENLAEFIARVLDESQKNGARQTWIELSDHGAGDGGGLEADSVHGLMSSDAIAHAIALGVQRHAQAHPQDAARRIDGVAANQCLMASLGFSDALSHAGVKYLAASPETMLSPGTPTTIASAIAKNLDDPRAMANAAVDGVMKYRYALDGTSYGPAAAFDVLDLDVGKWSAVERDVKTLNDAIATQSAAQARDIRQDAATVQGMVRFPEGDGLPWVADRPAIELYDTIASDGRLDEALRSDAARAAHSIQATVLAHEESAHFTAFGGADYRDAVGPTVHFPVSAGQIDPWAPTVSETDNAFFKKVDGNAETRNVVA